MTAVDVTRFAARLREARLAAEMRQADLAEATGYSQAAVSAWESGDAIPTLPALLAICRVLPLTLDDLAAALGGDPDAPPG